MKDENPNISMILGIYFFLFYIVMNGRHDVINLNFSWPQFEHKNKQKVREAEKLEQDDID